jgi:hypothetical protein
VVKANRNPPVFSAGQIEITASPEALWDLMADLSGWPSWNPDVKEVSVQGEVAEGTVFRRKAGPVIIATVLRPWIGLELWVGRGRTFDRRGGAPVTRISTSLAF